MRDTATVGPPGARALQTLPMLEEVNFEITQRYTSGARAPQATSHSSGQSSHLGSNRRRCRYRIKRGSILGWVRRTSFYRTLWRS
jgi:hypothetical protein